MRENEGESRRKKGMIAIGCLKMLKSSLIIKVGVTEEVIYPEN